VEISFVEEGPLKGLAWLQPRTFLEALERYNDLGHLLGGFRDMMAAKSLLTTFWERYRKVYPQFELFAEFEDGRKRPEQCIPIYLHGDEGVTYKKGGVLIFSWQSPLGYGSSRRPHQMSMNLQDMGECGLPLNFLKSGMYSRLLSIICPKDLVQQKCWFQKCCNIVFFLFP
jgi:hypothetical protein